MIGEIGSQVADIARTQGELDGLKAARAAHPNMSVEYLKKTPQYQDTQNKYGTGSDFQRGIQAASFCSTTGGGRHRGCGSEPLVVDSAASFSPQTGEIRLSRGG